MPIVIKCQAHDLFLSASIHPRRDDARICLNFHSTLQAFPAVTSSRSPRKLPIMLAVLPFCGAYFLPRSVGYLVNITDDGC